MFKFNNISSDDMKIIVEEELKLLKRASKKYNATEIPGRSGNIYEETGYADVEISLHLQLLDISKLNDIYKWLDGTGVLEYQDKVTTAYFYSENEPVRVGSIYTIDVTLIRAPFWTLKNDQFVKVENKVNNLGSIFSEPIIRLEKTTSQIVDLTINGVRFQYNFQNDNHVEIDCETCDATMNGLNRNIFFTIDFETPKLLVGENIITLHECGCIVKMKKKDRFL